MGQGSGATALVQLGDHFVGGVCQPVTLVQPLGGRMGQS